MASEQQARRVTLEVFRYRPEQEAEPTFQRYDVPFRREWLILDALQYVKEHLDGTLSFRWSCHMGICGSCGMMINGEAKLSCSAFLRDYDDSQPIRVEPLVNFPVIRDLVINMEDFLDKLGRLQPWLLPDSEPVDEVYSQRPGQLARYRQFSMCINCMLCYSACPVYGREPDFFGPAAIALAQRYNLDSRDAGADERLEQLAGEEGAWKCTFIGECSRVCPKHVDPAGAIQQAKLAAAKQYFRSMLLPWGNRK